MPPLAFESRLSEDDFAALVNSIVAAGNRQDELVALLSEDHPIYRQRGAPTVVRMRGWAMLALSRGPVPDSGLAYLLEELDTGIDAYLMGAAARALRAYPTPEASFAPFVMRGIQNIQFYEEPLSFEAYGEYAESNDGPSPLRELFATLVWLGPMAGGVLPELQAFRETCQLPKRLLPDLDAAMQALGKQSQSVADDGESCCRLPPLLANLFSWSRGHQQRADSTPIGKVPFEDHDGELIRFDEFFHGRPSIVVFFYTRCENALKCSLTVSKLARVQKLLESKGLAENIQTAAITYDPEYDDPVRLRRYGGNRDVSFGERHRMLRSMSGIDALREHFQLGVNFVDSLVNRHRVEAYILDQGGRIASVFTRIHWHEQEVVDRAIDVLREPEDLVSKQARRTMEGRTDAWKGANSILGVLPSVGFALFPKCPFCWAAYVSLFGIASLERLLSTPFMYGLLLLLMGINVFSVWLRCRAIRRLGGFYMVTGGALAILVSRIAAPPLAIVGVVCTLAGSVWSAWCTPKAAESLPERLPAVDGLTRT